MMVLTTEILKEKGVRAKKLESRKRQVVIFLYYRLVNRVPILSAKN